MIIIHVYYQWDSIGTLIIIQMIIMMLPKMVIWLYGILIEQGAHLSQKYQSLAELLQKTNPLFLFINFKPCTDFKKTPIQSGTLTLIKEHMLMFQNKEFELHFQKNL